LAVLNAECEAHIRRLLFINEMTKAHASQFMQPGLLVGNDLFDLPAVKN
jgi:hypothetical protein